MIDYFALLQQPRRPWLDPEKLKEKYHELAREAHPDRAPDLAAGDFAALNEAYRVLAEPKLRLRHLLELEGIPVDSNRIPNDLAELFIGAGTLIQEIDRLLARPTETALNRAVVQSQGREKLRETAELLLKLQEVDKSANSNLTRINQGWSSAREYAPALCDLATRFAYLQRWTAQLEERKFRLSALG